MQPENTYYGGGIGPANYQTPKKRLGRRQIFIGITAVLLVTTIILAVVSALEGGSQKKLSDDFVAKFVAADVDGTYELLSPETRSKETPASWSRKVLATKDFFSTYKQGSLIIDDPSLDGLADTESQSGETFTYVAKGKDGTYAFIVAVSNETADAGVVSFDSSPYVDTGGVLK